MSKISYGKRECINGNTAAALAVGLACLNGGVIPGYPITPQTEIIEKLSEMSLSGAIKAKFIAVESEHSAMMVAIGASPYARVFTATSSHGLHYMHEALHTAANIRLPIVMVNVSRGMGLPYHLGCDHNDIMAERDQGWGIIFAESNQEILDSVLIAFYLAERTGIPIIVNTDGFFHSHSAEPVIIPTQEQVDEFLPSRKPKKIDFENPETFYPTRLKAPLYYDMKKEQFETMENLKLETPKAYKNFEKIFGRAYGNGLVETYGPEKTEIIIVSYASHFDVIREMINEMESNVSISALKIRTLRPFPKENIAENLRYAQKILVVDRNYSCGIGGVFAQEVRAALGENKATVPVYNAIAGLGGENITKDMIKEAVEIVRTAPDSRSSSIIWLRNQKEIAKLNNKGAESKIVKIDSDSFYLPTHTACAGCGAAAPLRHILETLGEKIFLIIPACCHSITTGGEIGSADFHEITTRGKTIKIPKGLNMAIPTEHTLFAGAPATATGKKAALDQIGESDITVVCWCGDGSTYDIGFQALSAACERRESILYICYNNQAYMNTGVQRSSATPLGVYTNTSQLGKSQEPKNMMRIMAAHKIPYAATIILDKKHFGDLKQKVKKAQEIVKENRGLVYLELFTPCPPGWGCDTSLAGELSRLAFESKIWPVYEVVDGEIYIISKPKEISQTEQFELVKQYIAPQGRFKNFSDEDIKKMQEAINKNWEELLKLEWLSGKTLEDLKKIN